VKKIISILVICGLAGALSLNAAEESSGLYVGAGLNVEAVPDAYDSSGIGMNLKVGAHIDQVLPKLGVEAEYTRSISEPKNPASKKVEVQTVAAYLTYDICFKNSPMFVRPRLGVMLPNVGDKINSRDFGLSSGADVGVAISRSVSAYFGYTNMGETVNNYTLGVEVYF
jgi:hypothetical protein